MSKPIILFRQNKLEKSVAQISAKIAVVSDYSDQAASLTENIKADLLAVQRELEDLYLLLGEQHT